MPGAWAAKEGTSLTDDLVLGKVLGAGFQVTFVNLQIPQTILRQTSHQPDSLVASSDISCGAASCGSASLAGTAGSGISRSDLQPPSIHTAAQRENASQNATEMLRAM